MPDKTIISLRNSSKILMATIAVAIFSLPGCSMTGKKPEVAAVSAEPRAPSAAETMRRANAPKQVAQTKPESSDPAVSAQPNRGVADFRNSGRTATAALRPERTVASTSPQGTTPAPAGTQQQQASATAAMAGVVTQPTGIQAGRNSIFSASPALDAGPSQSAPAPASATGSISADAVAYAPARRINAASGSVFSGTPQIASNTTSPASSAFATVGPAAPGIATRPASSAAQPITQGLW